MIVQKGKGKLHIMKCSACGGKVTVTTALPGADNEIYRKRKCTECGRISYSTEFEVEFDDKFQKEWLRAYSAKMDHYKKRKVNA